MTQWVEVAALDALQRKKKLVVTVEGEDIVLFLHEGQVHAMADLCVHKQKRLSKGLIFQGKLICPGHQWAFDVKTGWEDQWSRCQPVYDVRLADDGMIHILSQPRRIDARPGACGAQ